MKLNFRAILTIVIVSTAAGLFVNFFSPNGISLIREERVLQEAVILPGVEFNTAEPQQINLSQAYLLYQQEAVFLDAREEADYNMGHIHKSLNLPYTHYEVLKDKIKDIPQDKIIVTYCGGSDCDLSILLADKLTGDGYKKVLVFFGGWNDWLTSNYPIVMNGQLYNAEAE